MNKHRIRWIAKYLVAVCLIALSASVFSAEVKDINVNELKNLISEGVTVIDVRTPGEWNQTGIVEGSIPIMFFDEKRKAHPIEWMNQASDYIQPGDDVAIICRTGSRSKVIGKYLIRQHGFESVYNVKGGIVSWVKNGNKTVKIK